MFCVDDMDLVINQTNKNNIIRDSSFALDLNLTPAVHCCTVRSHLSKSTNEFLNEFLILVSIISVQVM